MRKSRKLQFECLESRQLLSADLWPQSVGLKANVFVDGGAELSKVSLAKSATLAGLTREVFFTNSGATTRAVIGGNSQDTNGALLYPDGQPRFNTIFVNGGSAGHAVVMGAAGRQALETFYAHGGSYTGSCAGEFVAARRIPSLWGGKVGNQGNTGRQTVTFDETSHPLVQDLMRWNNGSNVVPSIPHYWGPTNRESYPHPDGTLFLGTITSGLHRGTDFLIEYQRDAESGVTVLSPSHPEYGRQASHTALMASILKRAVDLSRATPDIKGTLVSDQLVEMSGSTQRVGDGQYHRFTLEVPAGVGVLYVGLSNLSGNADLFIQRNGVAYAGSYLEKSVATGVADDAITIQNPEAGTYEVSVLGAHNVLNGVSYTLSAKLTDAVFAEAESAYAQLETSMHNFQQPKPTVFQGQTYKSRLEARWAAYFTFAEIPFVYEPLGPNTAPDFSFLSDGQLFYLEVKGAFPSESYLEELKAFTQSDLCLKPQAAFLLLGVGGFFDHALPQVYLLPSLMRVSWPQAHEANFNQACEFRFDLA
jgi:hypothetical protein